jgi:hypothetical protein
MRALTYATIAATALLSPVGAGAQPDDEETPVVSRNLLALPEQVQRMRSRIIDAARSGDIERLRPVIEMNELPPIFSFGGDDDPIADWRVQSGDGEGREILAIMLDLLEAAYVHIGPGTDYETYVWPYFYETDLATLEPWQEVELYRLVSPQQHRNMIEFGGYSYYRLGIGPDGTAILRRGRLATPI